MVPAPREPYNGFQDQLLQRRPFSDELMGQLQKTQLCRFHKKGKCNRHGNCSFAHTEQDLQSRPDLRKTKMCYDFFRNGCSDENCPFAHHAEELRVLPRTSNNGNTVMLALPIKSKDKTRPPLPDYTPPGSKKSSQRRQQHQKEMIASPPSSLADSTPKRFPTLLDSSPLSQDGYLLKSPKVEVEGYEIQVKATFVNLITLEEIDYKDSLRRTSSESALPSPTKAELCLED